MLAQKKILLAVSGSIAAYKSALIVRLLMKEQAEVRVIMTESAKKIYYPYHSIHSIETTRLYLFL